MANNNPPNNRILGIRGGIPSGYLLGRVDGGHGDVQLITMAKAQSVGLIPVNLPPSGAAGGDLSGTYPNPTVKGLQTRAVSASAPNNLDVLAWSSGGSAWAPLHLATVAYTGAYSDLTGLPAIHNIPAGGTTGQVLTKINGTDYNVDWETPSSGAPGSAMDDGTNLYLAMLDGAGQVITDTFGDPIWTKEVLPAAALPSLYARMSQAGAQSLSAGTNVVIAMDAITFDPNGWCDIVTHKGRVTPTIAGKYQVTVAVGVTEATGGTVGQIIASARIGKNGTVTSIVDQSVQVASLSSAFASASVTDILDMNGTTDFIEPFVDADGTTVATIGDARRVFITVNYIGP